MIYLPPPPFWPGVCNSLIFFPFSCLFKNFLYLTKSQTNGIMNICIWFPLESLILNIFSHLCLLALLLIGIQYVSHWEWNWASLHISNLYLFIYLFFSEFIPFVQFSDELLLVLFCRRSLHFREVSLLFLFFFWG